MSSSTRSPVVRGPESDQASGLRMPELRGGAWTRYGDTSARGDEVTEQLLDGLAESTRTAARAQGYAVGWAQGRHEAEQAAADEARRLAQQAAEQSARREAEHAEAVAALRAAAAWLEQEVADASRAALEQAALLALELTRELVGLRGVDADHVLARVTAELPHHTVVRVRLHPEVAADAGNMADHGVSVVGDPQLGRGDAVVEADDHVVDLRIDTALARLREVLS